ncbi:MAG: SRPBCC family protein [Bacteroidota bacterium]
MKKVIVTQRVGASPAQIWNILSTGTDLEKWLPIISTCKLEGSGNGAKRTCTTSDGKVLKETILLIDDNNRIFKYRIDEQDMMPLKNYIGTMKVLERHGHTDVSWSAEFDLTVKEAEAEVEKGLADLFKMAIGSLDLAAKQLVN